MRKLTKLPKPQILEDSGDAWTNDLMVEYYSTGNINSTKQNRYNKPQIKTTLKLETNDKCAYCESKITHVYPGDIEHIIPKSKYPRLTFTWSNLTFGCFWCNNKKRHFLDRENMLLNPYMDKIGEHIRAFGPLIFHINSSKRGEITWRKFEFNRIELRDKRQEKIEELQIMIDKHNCEINRNLKDLILEEIEEFILKSEFSFTLQQFYTDNINAA
mgnify:CR=1 FL=1